MKTALWPLQQGLYASLTAYTPLMNVVTGVFDEVAEEHTFPYVTIGEPNVSPFDTKTSAGENITWTLHCWSQDPGGKREAYAILNLMNQAFSQQPLSVSGFFVADFKREQMQVITDIDGVTRHGILRIRVHINQ